MLAGAVLRLARWLGSPCRLTALAQRPAARSAAEVGSALSIPVRWMLLCIVAPAKASCGVLGVKVT